MKGKTINKTLGMKYPTQKPIKHPDVEIGYKRNTGYIKLPVNQGEIIEFTVPKSDLDQYKIHKQKEATNAINTMHDIVIEIRNKIHEDPEFVSYALDDLHTCVQKHDGNWSGIDNKRVETIKETLERIRENRPENMDLVMRCLDDIERITSQ